MLIVGLDPGGARQFGWAVAETMTTTHVRLIHCGSADHARGAVDALTEVIGDIENVAAAGIDSPLFWVADGDRCADQTVRGEMRACRARYIDGTVQRVNSLRGACLVQGVMAARLLRRRYPAIRITESHPKALLWLLRAVSLRRPVAKIRLSHLVEWIECKTKTPSDHERDAALGAFAAAAMLARPTGWRDLALEERKAFAPVPRVEYWMPIAGSVVAD